MSSPSPPRPDPRYRLLDAWRGFACVMVVLHHAGFVLLGTPTSGEGWRVTIQDWVRIGYRRLDLGVPLFFVISGYCIAASMDTHRSRGASSWRFLRRRVWRIYPPYWAAVLCFVVVIGALHGVGWRPIEIGSHSLHLDGPGKLTWSQWLGNLTLTETWRHQAFGGSPYENLTRISWTLCFEEQFYFVGFVLLLVAPRRLFGALAVVSALIFAVDLAAFDAGWFGALEGIFPELWYQFAVGLAVYWRLIRVGSSRVRYAVDLALVGLASLGAVRSNLTITVVALFGLTLIALHPFDARLTAAPALTPLRACGLRCYSIYLVHLIVCTVGTEALIQLGWVGFWTEALLVAPLVASAGVGAGWLFFAAVESRFHNLAPARGSRAGREPSLAADSAAGPLDSVGAFGEEEQPIGVR